jgi:hypothetical protein
MRSNTTRALLMAALWIAPVAVFAAPPPKSSSPAHHPASSTKTAMADHATMGVVKSVNATALTITRSGKDAGEMTFVLNSTTKRDGKIEVGSPVSVRYKENGTSHVATAITAQHSKPQSTGKK